MNAIKKNATYEDIVDLPPGKNGELIDGELWVTPRPASPHAVAANAANVQLGPLGGFIDGPGGWHILFEPELHLGDDVLVPDLAAWRVERMPEVPDVAGFELAPDWICEAVSPSTARLDREIKLPRYARHGVEWAWIIDAPARSLEVFRRRADAFEIAASFTGAEIVRATPFEAVELDLARWWRAA